MLTRYYRGLLRELNTMPTSSLITLKFQLEFSG